MKTIFIDAAIIIWAAGTAIVAFQTFKGYARLLTKDPLAMCDKCRDMRRENNSRVKGTPPWLATTGLLISAMPWPLVYLVKIGRWLMGKGWNHSCTRAKQAQATS